MSALPIEPVLPRLRRLLAEGNGAVLQAPPGAGKTTGVPLALLEEAWLSQQRIILLEPRRLAARAAAHRMASLRGEAVGETVGYRVRWDTRVGPQTRLEVVTEGVLTRMLQSDPGLEGVGLVIFDEFHERSLHADLGLALCLQTRSLLRPELRLLVMSATLEGAPVAELLNAPLVTSAGQSFPVEMRYRARPRAGQLEAAVGAAIADALTREDGDILVFLPGAAEIRRLAVRLEAAELGHETDVVPLYGDLPPEAQDRAIQPSRAGRRKIVLATSIAETSLTIGGIGVVIDSGLMRVPRYSARTGMARLATVPVTRASAEQRAGRAGRLGPGVCYRLWTQAEQLQLTPQGVPEILSTDLSALALELAAWGVEDANSLTWLDPPPPTTLAQARELLGQLGAIEPGGRITGHGRRIAQLAAHPRVGHLLLRGAELGHGVLACDLAALLEERDILRAGSAPWDADVRPRLEALQAARAGRHGIGPLIGDAALDGSRVRRVLATAREWRKRLRLPMAEPDTSAVGVLLALAYPDRIGQRRPGRAGRFRLRTGRGAVLLGDQSLSATPYLVAAELGGEGRESRIYLAAPITREELEEHFLDQVEEEVLIEWDSAAGAVRARQRERLGELVLREAPVAAADPDRVLRVLLAGIRQVGLRVLSWTRTATQLRQRLVFLRRLDASWPDVSEDALLRDLERWLGPYAYGMRTLAELQRLNLTQLLLDLLSTEQRRQLETLAPAYLQVPSGSRVAIDYQDPSAPALAVRLQEMFGLEETPRIGGGAVPLTLQLLSPAQRPVQVTRDLANFWRTTYFEVRKELKGRYPKHYWPDDPRQAIATRRVRPR